MRGVITAPRSIITGAFNVRFDFIRPIELLHSDVRVETLQGDALGNPKDSFGGSGAHYHMLCYPPDNRSGRSRISVIKDGLEVEPIESEYDTIRTVRPTWGSPIQRAGKVELPLTFDVAIEDLRKRNFRFTAAVPFQLYGSGTTYSLIVPRRRFQVTILGKLRKSNGVQVTIEETDLEVEYGIDCRN